MAKLFFGLNQSLDGYVDHLEFATGPALFRHFYEQVRDLTGSVYGRRMYGATRLRGGVAEATEVGRVALVEVSRPQCHTCRG
jgi:hypothetical protein